MCNNTFLCGILSDLAEQYDQIGVGFCHENVIISIERVVLLALFLWVYFDDIQNMIILKSSEEQKYQMKASYLIWTKQNYWGFSMRNEVVHLLIVP